MQPIDEQLVQMCSSEIEDASIKYANGHATDFREVARIIIAALRAQADAQPVAWEYTDCTGSHISKRPPVSFCPDSLSEMEVKVTPLYTHPTPEAAQAGLDSELWAAAQRMVEAFAPHADKCRPCTMEWQNLKAILTRASAATVAEPSDSSEIACSSCGLTMAQSRILSAQQQAEPSKFVATTPEEVSDMLDRITKQAEPVGDERAIIEALWSIIDDIDTYDDAARSDDAAFRKMVRARQADRWKTGITTDGYALKIPAAQSGQRAPGELPPIPPNVVQVTRRIRRCVGDVAAQVVLEHFAMEYARAAMAGRRAGVAEGWCFYSADFSMNASNPVNWGTVMLTRDDAGRKWWHDLSGEEREKIDLFVSGRGTTFDAAMKAANEKAAIAAAPTPAAQGEV